MGMTRAHRITRWLLEALLVAFIVGALALLGLARVAPAIGHPVFVIRSGSMAPAIPVGAAVVLDPGPAGVRAGDVVTLRLDNGAIFTHRVTLLVTVGGVPYVETKGDANAAVDPALTPLDHILGRVSLTLPLVGYLMADLAIPVGVGTALLAALTLVAALWLLDEDGDEDSIADPAGPIPAGQPRAWTRHRHQLDA
jgi:signal peptidase